MHAVTPAARPLLSVLTVLGLAVGLAAIGAAPVAASGGGTGGCNPYVDGTVIPVPCSSGSASSGSSGSGGGVATVGSSCTTFMLGKAQAENLGLSWPPPQGESWAIVDCLGGAIDAAPQAVLVSNATGAPAIAPQQLLLTAVGQLQVPHLGPSTAPPRGHDGLVGLPEWYWIPADNWHARTVTVTAGQVWAVVTATPVGLTFQPGPGIRPVSCTGPGVAYNPHKPAAAQHTDCSYTYREPSMGQPGDAYQASVTVTWRVTWTGSGGAGGVLDAALSVPVGFAVPVAQGEALVTGP
ncbi:MAG TPA: hypothetical protein VGH96_23445 [Streptosporangiaceae bacterium]